jgi:glycosyltransferase involved in cell wall biosynthesis
MMASIGKPRGLRVLIIVEKLPVPFDRRVWNEAKALTAAGHRVSIICPTGKGFEKRQEEIDGIAVYRHPLPIEASRAIGYPLEYSAALFWEGVLSWKVLWQRGFDVIQACNPPDTIFVIGGFWKLLLGKRFVFDQHDLGPELFEANFHKRGILHRMLLLAERLTYRTADIVISTNNSYREVALRRGRIDPEKVFVVRSGPDLARMRILPAQPELKNGRRHLVGYLGVIGKHEGIEYLLDAVADIVFRRQRTDIQFVLVGGGSALEDLKRKADEMKIAEYITFTGRVSDEVLLQYLNTAEVCVNPDEVNEMNDKSTMNKIMEYMALGKPIVQFEVAEGRYSAQEASLYAKPNDSVDFADKIVTLLADPMLCAQMGEFGRARVENELAWRHEVPKLLAAYEAVAAAGQGATARGLPWLFGRRA